VLLVPLLFFAFLFFWWEGGGGWFLAAFEADKTEVMMSQLLPDL